MLHTEASGRLGLSLAIAIDKSNLPLDYVTRELRCSENHLMRIIRGHWCPSIVFMDRICTLLGLDIEAMTKASVQDRDY